MDRERNGRLVLGVKENEPVYVGDDVEVVVSGFTGKVSLIFTAPKNIKILRAKTKEQSDAKGDAYLRST